MTALDEIYVWQDAAEEGERRIVEVIRRPKGHDELGRFSVYLWRYIDGDAPSHRKTIFGDGDTREQAAHSAITQARAAELFDAHDENTETTISQPFSEELVMLSAEEKLAIGGVRRVAEVEP